MTCHDAGRLIDAYVDDELSPEDAASLAAHLEACALCRNQLQEREALRRVLHAVPAYQAPERLRAAVMAAGTQRAGRRARIWAVAAALVALLGGVQMLSTYRTSRATATIADALVGRHVSAMARQPLVDVESTDRHTVKPWFQGKLAFSPPVVDLAAAGFPLVGGRVERAGGQVGAGLVYHARLHVIEVFIWPASEGAAASDRRSIRGFQEVHWSEDGLSLWAVSDVNAAELDAFVAAFRAAAR
jgi:anti-sigma factor (TIGR02949 family)